LQTHTRLDAGSTNNNTSRLDEEEFDASRVSHFNKQLIKNDFFFGVINY